MEDMESRDSDLAQILTKYDRLVDWERRDRSAMKVDIAPLRDLLRHLNNPQKKFRTIHIVGTKGKGSVGALIEAGLHRAGLACGPVLVTPCRTNYRTCHIRWSRDQRVDAGENAELRVVVRERTLLNSEPGGNNTRF